MKNFTLLGRSLVLAICLLGLTTGSLQAQFCNFNANNIDVEINNTCNGSVPYATINFNNFFLDGEMVIRYEPVWAGVFTVTGVNYEATVDVVSGFGAFEIGEPRLPGFTNNFVRILEVSFTGFCTQTFSGNELLSNTFDFDEDSDITFSNEQINNPPCAGVPSGSASFLFTPGTANGPGFNNFNRFEVVQQPFVASAVTSVNPPNTGINNSNTGFLVTTQGLPTGTYTYLINDLQTGCQTTYDITISGGFDVDGFVSAGVSCFGESDGEITIRVIDADPFVNGPLNWAIQGIGVNQNGTVTAVPSGNTFVYPDVPVSGLPAGTYSVFLTSGFGGCTAQEDNIVLSEPSEIVVSNLDVPAICTDEPEFTLNIGTISGFSSFNSTYKFIDGTINDGNFSNDNGCWTRDNGGNGFSFPNFPDVNGNYVLTAGTANPGFCRGADQDTMVVINLEITNGSTGCTKIFPFTLHIDPSLNADLSADLTVGSLSAQLESGDVLAQEICSGEDFTLDNLMFTNVNATTDAKFVRTEIYGDARFLSIDNGGPYELGDLQLATNSEISSFALGVMNIQNNNPSNSAQVTRILLTPYYEEDANNPSGNLVCAGETIELFLTLNPTPPALMSPQRDTVCSDERIMYTIGGAGNMSGMGGLETRITAVELFTSSNEFVVPEGADRIEDFTFNIAGANGGATAGAMGGLGGRLTGELDDTELMPGDTVRIRKGEEGKDASTAGDGGDATTLVVIRPGVGMVYTFVAGGGGGAGNSNPGADVAGLSNSAAGDGAQGAGPGGFGGTGFPAAEGGDGVSNGGGGGGGYLGGDGGSSLSGEGGDAGTSFATAGLNVAPATAPKSATEDGDGSGRVFYTVVYDDIRFDLVSRTVAPGLLDVGEMIVDGEVDTILFGQQFVNPTDGPLEVSYLFDTRTEANCEDGSQVEVIVTVEPEPTGFLVDGATDIDGDVMNGYTATICSGDALEAFLNSNTVPTLNTNRVFFRVNTAATPGTGFFGGNGTQASGSNNFGGGNSGNDFPIRFFENGVFNNTGAPGTITYTISPFIRRAGQDNCAGEPFTFTVTVNPGFSNNDIVTPVQQDLCSRDLLSADGFDLATSQPNINNGFNSIRVVDFRVGTNSPNFDSLVLFDTTGLAMGNVILTATNDYFNDNQFRNRTGGGVTVEYDVRLISDDGCESQVITYPFLIRAEPIIDTTNNEITVCSGDAIDIVLDPATNSAFFNNFGSVSFDYTLDAPNLTYLGSSIFPAAGEDRDFIENDAFQNNTDMPQTATYTVLATTNPGCTSDPVATFTVTVLPRPDIVVTAEGDGETVNANGNQPSPPTITICSGSTVNFGLTQPVTGVDVFYRMAQGASANITDGGGNNLQALISDLTVDDFMLELNNSGSAAETVTFAFRAYNVGPNGFAEGGNGDDCTGEAVYVNVEVLPNNEDETDLRNRLIVDGNQLAQAPTGVEAQVCDFSEVIIRPLTALDPNSGLAFVWTRENDGTPLSGATSGNGMFPSTPNGNGNYVAAGPNRIRQVLEAEDTESREVRYIVTVYSFGNNGVDDMLMPGSDDCPGDVDTVTVLLDPTPTLTADIAVGTQTGTLNAGGSPYIYEVCDGDDFLLNNLMIPELADGKANYVELSAGGNIDFLGLPNNGGFFNIYTEVAPVGTFALGAQNIQNTSGGNSAQTAILSITPYFEDGNDDSAFDPDECGGEPIIIFVTLNPSPPDLGPFTEVVCSEERVEYTIPGASGMNGQNRSRVAGSFDFSTSNDFVVPPGVFAIRNVDITLTGANGGGVINGDRGGLGGSINVLFNPFFGGQDVMPGDTIRVRKGMAGTDDTNHGNGGDATLVCFIAGPNGMAPLGQVYETFVAAGGGGAGAAAAGDDVSGGSTDPNMPAPGDGADGLGLGGFGGTGWVGMNPASGSMGGEGRSSGGGGGGGWLGGNGGSSIDALGGGAGSSYAGNNGGPLNANFATKELSDAPEGEVNMTFTLVYDDVRFTLVNRMVGTGLVDQSDNPIVNGETDTILFGERFFNPTNEPIDVVYNFSTSSEANCPGGTVEVTLTVEPNPTIELSSRGTMVVDNTDGTYSATICSGDSLSATLSSATMPTGGVAQVRAEVIDVEAGPSISFDTNPGDRASEPNGDFGGAPNNRPAENDIYFFEGFITNVGTMTEQVTYTIVPRIVNPGEPNCFGDTIRLTVDVEPEFVGVDQTPAQFGLCSNVSLDDAGFDFDATQTVQIAYDSIMIDTVVVSPNGASPNFDTISSVYNSVPVMVRRSLGFFGEDTYRNRVGAPVIVTYTVRLVSGPGCFSDPITYNFRYTAEPVIDLVESATNQIDTSICTVQTTGLVVNPAANSAWSNPADFDNNVDLAYSINLPVGVTLTKTNGTYPNADGGTDYMEGDILTNNTDAPLDVVYTVKPSNNGCAGDSVLYTVTVNPNPQAAVTLTSLDSVKIFSLDNSRMFLDPNPTFNMCSGQALDVVVSDSSSADRGRMMARVTITGLDTITGDPATVTYLTPVSALGDSLSYAAGELVNTSVSSGTGALGPDTFTVKYFTFFERNMMVGNQGVVDGDCPSDGTVEFDVVISPVNTALVRVEDTGNTPLTSGNDTLCSGDLFNLFMRAAVNDPTLPAIDSFRVAVNAPAGIVAGLNTEADDFWVTDQNVNSPYAERLSDLSFANTTPGIKTIEYIVTPWSDNCAGLPDTTTISYRPEINLSLDTFEVICTPNAIVFNAVDLNQASSTVRQDYDWAYIGGDASNFILSRQNDNDQNFISSLNNNGQVPPIEYMNRRFLKITTQAGTQPGTAVFRIDYESPDGCTIRDTLTMTITNSVTAGTPDNTIPIACEGPSVILLEDYLIGETAGGRWFRNDMETAGSFNGVTGSFVANNLNGGGALLSYEFGYAIGRTGSGCDPDTSYITVEVQSEISAGIYTGMPIEACDAAPLVNLFDALTGEESGGSFVQLSGTDNVFVDGADGIFDQTGVTPGTYTYSYQVAGRNGCPGDDETVIVEVKSLADCSDPVPCDVITLSAGFNVISFDVMPNDNSVEAIFADEIASNNLQTVVARYPNEPAPQSYTFVPGFGGVNNITAGLLPGYGFIVEVDQPTTVTVCGTAVDPDLRVELIADLNIVGYVPSAPASIFDYFDELISNNDLVVARTRENGQTRELFFQPFVFGNLANVENGLGYIIQVNSAYADGSWREGSLRTSAVFDRFYGIVAGGEEMEGEKIRFVDADGTLVGVTEILPGGKYLGAMVFGDIAATERDREGLEEGAEFFAEIRGELFPVSATFTGDWKLRRVDIDASSLSTDTEDPQNAGDNFQLKVFPNPAVTLTTVNLTTVEQHDYLRVELYSLLGQIVNEQHFEHPAPGVYTVDMNLSDLPSGIYQLRVSSENGMLATQQIVRK